jgi:hypothetical protein
MRRSHNSIFLCAVAALAALITHSPLLAGSPPLRTGLWVTQRLPAGDAALRSFESDVKASRDLRGVCLHIPWDQIERASGKADFTDVDRAVAVLRNARMSYQLCLKPGASTPAFVYADGAQSFKTQVANPHRANYGAPIQIPVPWDPVYERYFTRMIDGLGQRYANDPLCVSVVLTCANFLSAEMHLPKNHSDLARWRSFGDYETRLLEVYKTFTDEWAKAFPRQEISLHVSKVLDLPPSFCERIIDYGLARYPNRFSIQSCQLTGRKEDTGVMTYDLVQRYRDRLHHGFQSLAALDRPDGRMGSAEMAALNLVHAGAEYWELWHGDGFDPKIASRALNAWEEAKKEGYEAYKNKLIAEGKYRAGR